MQRAVFVVALAFAAGCQSQNPYAAFGPPTVPAPGSLQTPPYYPPGTGAVQNAKASAPQASARISVSADRGSVGQSNGSSFVADPGDREPIRVVENPTPPTRTAAAGGRTEPGKVPAKQPSAATPANTLPGNKASGTSPPGQVPTSQSSSLNRARGFATKPGATGGSNTTYVDPAVAPASYDQAAAVFTESQAPAGQWRAR